MESIMVMVVTSFCRRRFSRASSAKHVFVNGNLQHKHVEIKQSCFFVSGRFSLTVILLTDRTGHSQRDGTRGDTALSLHTPWTRDVLFTICLSITPLLHILHLGEGLFWTTALNLTTLFSGGGCGGASRGGGVGGGGVYSLPLKPKSNINKLQASLYYRLQPDYFTTYVPLHILKFFSHKMTFSTIMYKLTLTCIRVPRVTLWI